MDRDLARWHKVLAPLVGEIGLALILRRVKRSVMEGWAEVLEEAAREIREAARGGEK